MGISETLAASIVGMISVSHAAGRGPRHTPFPDIHATAVADAIGVSDRRLRDANDRFHDRDMSPPAPDRGPERPRAEPARTIGIER